MTTKTTCHFDRLPFAVFEGVDRSGKGEQSRRLATRLSSLGRRVSTYATPRYQTDSGRVLQKMLRQDLQLEGAETSYQDDAVALQALHTANRYHVNADVRRDLSSGRIVVCARWWPSAVVYAELDKIDAAEVRASCAGLIEPGLLILLDACSKDVGGRLDRGQRYEGDPRLVDEARDIYQRIWLSECERSGMSWWIVDASGSPEEVEERVWTVWRAVFPELAEPAVAAGGGLRG